MLALGQALTKSLGDILLQGQSEAGTMEELWVTEFPEVEPISSSLKKKKKKENSNIQRKPEG